MKWSLTCTIHFRVVVLFDMQLLRRLMRALEVHQKRWEKITPGLKRHSSAAAAEHENRYTRWSMRERRLNRQCCSTFPNSHGRRPRNTPLRVEYSETNCRRRPEAIKVRPLRKSISLAVKQSKTLLTKLVIVTLMRYSTSRIIYKGESSNSVVESVLFC